MILINAKEVIIKAWWPFPFTSLIFLILAWFDLQTSGMYQGVNFIHLFLFISLLLQLMTGITKLFLRKFWQSFIILLLFIPMFAIGFMLVVFTQP